MREDLEAAGLPYQDEIGEFADFQALRHTFVTKACDSGADAPTVMKPARHKDIKTTMRYTHQDESAQIAAIRAMKPPGKKSG
ncbi:Tyrosine recombinase XerC [Planctomycetes bacterium K23_9]|uniref:Tyrosine recombinase XerC n=2 Tax=Stieleria marina TaxID=1930275 RepID=A0A517P131_9BACT|nr:Tyrosine recombinase XerC [Planctomycetes bacterium K23_9]